MFASPFVNRFYSSPLDFVGEDGGRFILVFPDLKFVNLCSSCHDIPPAVINTIEEYMLLKLLFSLNVFHDLTLVLSVND